MKRLSWKPIRKNERYCSPACGRGCTFAEYLAAKRRGRLALSKLEESKNWKLEVWENLGWHVALYNEGVWLSVPKEKDSGFNLQWKEFNTPSFEDPNKAIENMLKQLEKRKQKISETMLVLNGGCYGRKRSVL